MTMVQSYPLIGKEEEFHDPLKGLDPGMVILLDHPRRVARIEGPTTYNIVVETRENNRPIKTISQKPAVQVTVAILDKSLGEMVSETELAQMCIVRDSVLACPDDYNDAQWAEKWGTRPCGILVNPVKSAAYRSEDKWGLQLYCAEVEGRNPEREATSPVCNRPVTGQVVPHELVPDGLFRTPVELREEAEEVQTRETVRAEKAAEKQRQEDHEQRMLEIHEMARARVEAEREYDAAHGGPTLAADNAALQKQLADLQVRNASLEAAQKLAEKMLEPEPEGQPDSDTE